MKWLAWTNSPHVYSGYGCQARALLPRLQALGHEAAVAANFGLTGASLIWKGIVIYPLFELSQNMDVIGYYAGHFGADIVLSLYDIWALPPDTRRRLPCPWAALVPVDGAPVSEVMKQRLATVDYPVALSRFGLRELEKVGVEASYIPLAIDSGKFCRADKKAQARLHLGIPPEVFLVTTVAANKGFPPRKSWPELLTAFVEFRKRHSDAMLYCHTTKAPHGSGGQGVIFDDLIKELEIPKGAIAFPDQGALAVGVPDEEMVLIYQASDVMLLPSRGEGFGLPILEAQACGCPVIVQDCSSMPELTVNGLIVEPLQRQWLPQLGYWWQMPDVGRIVEALEEIYAWDLEKRVEIGNRGVKFVRKNYDWEVVWEKHWIPFLEHVEDTLW